MDESIAKALVEALSHHPWLPVPDQTSLTGLLVRTRVEDSRRFYEPVAQNDIRLEECDRIVAFSLRRVLRVRQARGYSRLSWKKTVDALGRWAGVYSSSALCRSLRADPDMVNLLERSDQPFALLGKREIVEFDLTRDRTDISITPVLVVSSPNVSLDQVLAWEQRHTVSGNHPGLASYVRKRLPRYYSQES